MDHHEAWEEEVKTRDAVQADELEPIALKIVDAFFDAADAQKASEWSIAAAAYGVLRGAPKTALENMAIMAEADGAPELAAGIRAVKASAR